MPTPEEQALLDLLPQQRQAAQEPEAPRSLPELTPEMLLGRSALMEFQAAQQIQLGTPVTLNRDATRVRPALPGEPQVGIVRENRSRVIEGQEVPMVLTSEPSMAELSSLFMNGEAEAMADLSGGTYAVADGFDIEYDADFPEGSTAPNPTARFQVGRENPPSMPFNRTPMSGPSDGQVVAQRGADGSFHQVPRPEPQRPSPSDSGWARTSQRMETLRRAGGLAGPARDRIQAELQSPAKPRPEPAYRPTAWERIIGDD